MFIAELRDDLTYFIFFYTEKNFGSEFLVFELILLFIIEFERGSIAIPDGILAVKSISYFKF